MSPKSLSFPLCWEKTWGKPKLVQDYRTFSVSPGIEIYLDTHHHTLSHLFCRIPQPLSPLHGLSFHWKVVNYDSCQRCLSSASFAMSRGTLLVTHRPFSTGVECYYMRGIRGWKGIFSDRAKQLITQLTPNNLSCAEMSC